MTTFTIIILFLLIWAIVVALFYRSRANNFLRTSRSQQIQINAYRDANCDPNAIYQVRRVIATDDPELPQYNWGVCRLAASRGFMFCTTIKVFTDEDDDFNLREAEELCEMLNSK